VKKSLKTYTLEEAKRALEHYCIYQDRCHKEVEEKLSKMRLIPEIIEEVIPHLISENFLNETRFAQSFARGKFRIKKWGKNRIVAELKQRCITDYNIKIALQEIEPEQYTETLETLIVKKIKASNENDVFRKKKKIIDYLLRQGYEPSLIYEFIAYHF
jgi:regulatory protein